MEKEKNNIKRFWLRELIILIIGAAIWVLSFFIIHHYNLKKIEEINQISSTISEIESSENYINYSKKKARQQHVFYSLPSEIRQLFDVRNETFRIYLEEKIEKNELESKWQKWKLDNRPFIESLAELNIHSAKELEEEFLNTYVFTEEKMSAVKVSSLKRERDQLGNEIILKLYFTNYKIELIIYLFVLLYVTRVLFFLVKKTFKTLSSLKVSKKTTYYIIGAVFVLFITKPNADDFEEMGHNYIEKKYDALIFNCYITNKGTFIGVLGNGIKISNDNNKRYLRIK